MCMDTMQGVRGDVLIHMKQLLPILLATATWVGVCKKILFKCDNVANVYFLSSSTDRDPLVAPNANYRIFFCGVQSSQICTKR